MTQPEPLPSKFDSLGGIFTKNPLRWNHVPPLMTFTVVVAGVLWLQWAIMQVHKQLAAVLPPVGNVTPDRAGLIISVTASVLVILAVWTATWVVFSVSDQPLRNRLRNLSELSAIVLVYGVVLLVEGDLGRDYPFAVNTANTILIVTLLRFRSANRQRDSS